MRQVEFALSPHGRGIYLITEEIEHHLPALPSVGMVHLFLKHTSAALAVNENADPDVRSDLEKIFDRMIREREPYYDHRLEGADDMPAHGKSVLVGVSLLLPVSDGRLNLGCWQGIYLCEFRDQMVSRRVVATVME